jgi:hypothetical protein
MSFFVVRLSPPTGQIETYTYDASEVPPTVSDVLDRAGYTPAQGEKPFVDGSPVDLTYRLPVRNSAISVVQTASGGK